MAKEPGQFAWSSYRATAGLTAKPRFLTVDWILGQFGAKPAEARRQYREFVLAGMEQLSPWEDLKAQCILGGKEFPERITPWLKERSKLSEIPKRQRFAFRPALDQVLGEDARRSKTARNMGILSAHLDYGYTLTEIARHLGLHYTTISKVVRQYFQ